jgi:hypothetical protein
MAELGELKQLLTSGHQLMRRALGSTAEIREEDVQVLAEAYAGVGSALDALLPGLRVAARVESTLQRLDGLRRKAAGEDRGSGVP